MKIRLHVLIQFVLLASLFVFPGCSEDAQQTSSSSETVLGADPATVILEVFGEPDRFARTEKLISVLRAVSADQAYAFEEALIGLDTPNSELDRVLILTAWAKYDAPAATKWVKNHEREDIVRNAMFAESVYIWALEDHESFLSDMEMALFIAPGFEPAALRAFIKGWFDSGAPRLESFIRDMTRDTIDRQRSVDTLIGLMTERDGAVAMVEWAKAVRGDVHYRASVNSRVAAEVVLIDSKLITDWCAEICDTKLGEEMPHMIAASWVMQSPEEAMDFISSMPNAISVRTGTRAAFRRFVIADPDRALAWLETTTEEQRKGEVLQGPVAAYVNRSSLAGQNLLALEWLEYVSHEEEREKGAIMIVRRWLENDESAAEAWMAESSMSEEAKTKAREGAARGSTRR